MAASQEQSTPLRLDGQAPPFLPAAFRTRHDVIDYGGAYARGYTEVFQLSAGLVTAVEDMTVERDWSEWLPFSDGLRLVFVIEGCAEIRQADVPPIALEPLSFGIAVDPLDSRKMQTRVAGRRWRAMAIFCPGATLPSMNAHLDRIYEHGTAAPSTRDGAFTYKRLRLEQRQRRLVEAIFDPGVSAELKPLYVEAKTLELLTVTLQALSQMESDGCPASGPGLSGLTSTQLDRVQEICHIIAHNLTDVPSLSQLSRRVGTNRRQICSDFRTATGRSIGRYILEQRMDRARELLAEHRPVKLVSHMVGYRHPQNFVTAYKGFFGVTPGLGQG